jgi:ribosomal protein S12 methylthiotransferase
MPIRKTKVGMISLGCAKNLVDAEIMLGGVLANGMEVTSDADEADVLIVNTCAFIDSAKEESVEAILDAHRGRGMKKRKGQKLIVSGCMAQRFSRELVSELPEVDAFLGLDQVKDTAQIIEEVLHRGGTGTPIRGSDPFVSAGWQPLNLVTRKPVYIPDWDTPRMRLTPGAHRVHENSRGVQSPVQLLCHSADARAAP